MRKSCNGLVNQLYSRALQPLATDYQQNETNTRLGRRRVTGTPADVEGQTFSNGFDDPQLWLIFNPFLSDCELSAPSRRPYQGFFNLYPRGAKYLSAFSCGIHTNQYFVVATSTIKGKVGTLELSERIDINRF